MTHPTPFARLAAGALAISASATLAQFDPDGGQWGKDDPTDVRVMTWNVEDGIASERTKTEGFIQWNALTVIVAAMRPDVLVVQEAGDNGGFVDNVANLTQTFELFIHGGEDPFLGGEVTSYVQKYAPDYDLPHIFVANKTDGFNRNVILSRFPFADLNGDTKAAISDIPFVVSDEWAPGGNGGIRGFQFVEIDLPDETYAGDLVVGGAHLKAGGDPSDHAERVTAARNVSYVVRFLLNGDGTQVPDPNDKIFDTPEVTNVLPPATPVILAGDWNEDELANGATKGPAAWLVDADVGDAAGGDDGTDRDGTDSTLAPAVEFFTGDPDTLGSSTLDYIGYQDSIATLRHTWIFDSGKVPGGSLPPELDGFPAVPGAASNVASDHLPVLADFALPLGDAIEPPGPFALLSPAPGEGDVPTEPTLSWELSDEAETYEVVVLGDGGVVFQQNGLTETSVELPEGTLEVCEQYNWGVVAFNDAGDTASTPAVASFSTVSAADVNQDGALNILDFVAFQALFAAQDPFADFNDDGAFNILDFIAFQAAFSAGGC